MLAEVSSIVVPPTLPPTLPPTQVEADKLRLRGAAGVFSATQSIGVVAPPRVSSSFSRGVYQLAGIGTGIGGTADQFVFVSRPADGDGSMTTRVSSIANTQAGAKAGLMVRADASASAAFVGIFVTPGSGISFIRRLANGGSTSQSIIPGPTAPRYLKLTRIGNDVAASHSTDGVSWTLAGSASAAVGANPLVGLAATSNSATVIGSAVFSHVNVLLPVGTSASDIGTSAVGGSTNYVARSNRYTVSGYGTEIGGASDQASFVARSMLGNGAIIATVDVFSGAGPSSRAGIMIRDGSAASSTFAAITATPAGVIQFQWRSAAGAIASTTILNVGAGAPSLKLVRSGMTVSAFYSVDRANWTPLGTSQPITFTSALAPAGLVMISGSATTYSSATFAGVTHLEQDGTSIDVGNTLATGSALADVVSTSMRMLGRGIGIGQGSDQFSFIARPMSGNGDAVVYVDSASLSNPAARAGIMLRGSNALNAPFVSILLTSAGLIRQSRLVAGGPVSATYVNGVAGPVSLKLTRAEGGIVARYSTDGTTWLAAGSSVAISLPGTISSGLVVSSGDATTLTSAQFTGFEVGMNLPPGAGVFSAADQGFLNDLEARSILFFYNEANATTGLVPDGSSANGGAPSAASSIASVGFGLSALAIADERGFLTHQQAYQRALTTINFLYNNVAHVNGFFYHFINPVTGARAGLSELSPMDTALLMAGVIHAAEYWKGTPLESVANDLFDRVNWNWMLKPNGQFYGHWTPEKGFEFGYGDFSEAVLIYLLGLGSATHPTSMSTWNAWSRSPVITYGGSTFITAQTRALFTTQYPLGWFDLRGKTDAFGLNYFTNAQKATLAQRQLAINLSGTYPHYGANIWGLTAADGPNGYTVWGGPPATSNVDGAVVPTAPGGSLAFVPRQSVDALRAMQTNYGTNVYRKYGFVDAFNPAINWTSSIVLGIDVGMMLLAAENARNNSVWNAFGRSSIAQTALARAFGSALLDGESSTAAARDVNAAELVVRPATPSLSSAKARATEWIRSADSLFV